MGKIYSVKDNRSEIQDEKGERSQVGSKSYANREQRVVLDLSTNLILFVLLVLGLLFFSKQLIWVVMFLFTSFVIMSTMNPVVRRLEKMKVSKGLSITIVYFLFMIITLVALVLVFVPFVNQVSGLFSLIPGWLEEGFSYLKDFSIAGYTIAFSDLKDYLINLMKEFPTVDNFKNIASVITDLFGFGAFLVTSIIFSIYLVSEHDSFFNLLLIRIVSDEKRDRVKRLVYDVETKLGSWVLGQVTISLFAALFSGILLTILNVPFALSLAIITGLLGVIPSIGATVAGISMALVALLSVNPLTALIVLVGYMIYQQIESSVIAPKVMGSAVGLKPIFVLFGVMVSLTFFGLIGGIIAVPIMVIAQVLYEFYIDLQKLKAKGIV